MRQILVSLSLLLSQSGFATSWWDMPIEQIRQKINEYIFSIEASETAVFSIENKLLTTSLREVPIRIYRPNNLVDLPTILLIHGGAFVAGSVDTHDNLARYLCYKVQAIVVSVDYRVAPEGKFPFALEQCYDVLISIQHAPKIAVVGDSAGGNMAAALCLMSRDRCGPKIDLQVLINPAPDLTCNGTILRQNDPLDVLRLQAFHYLADPKDANHPYVSPLIATSLKELPEAVVILAEKDELYEMGLSYANRLQEAKIPTEVYCQKGIGHLAGHGARAAPQAQESLDIAVDRIKNIFRR